MWSDLPYSAPSGVDDLVLDITLDVMGLVRLWVGYLLIDRLNLAIDNGSSSMHFPRYPIQAMRNYVQCNKYLLDSRDLSIVFK